MKNKKIKQNDALKESLFRAYNACRCINVGQALPDNKANLITNNSCVVVPVLQPYGAGSEQPLLRTSALSNKGFTLIELLVVVLIIGILAAIALPQYQKAVMKSRFATLKHLVKGIANAQEVYYLANGKYTGDLNELDIEFPVGNEPDAQYFVEGEEMTATRRFYPWGNCVIESVTNYGEAYCRNTDIEMSYQIRFKHSKQHPGLILCNVYVEDAQNSPQAKVCQGETGLAAPSMGKSYIYTN